ncbi:MAG: aryl-sulfate sulfotransferase [Bryobacterales bacterium]|nr:aryl-sulfate sulfotransferase [Bryobacterales bacterium]
MRLLAGLMMVAGAAWAAPRFIEEPSVAANPNASVPLAAVVHFAASEAVSTLVEVSDGKNAWTLRYGPEREAGKGLAVVGMRPGRRHEIAVTIVDAKGAKTRAVRKLEWTTPELPKGEGEFPAMRVTVAQRGKMEPGYRLFSPRRSGRDQKFSTSFGMLCMVDGAGEVVWYYRTNSRVSDVQPMRNGNIAFVTQDYRAVEIDLLGNVVQQWYAGRRPAGKTSGAAIDTITFHHELDELPNGNLVVLSSEVRELDNYYTSETDEKAPRQRMKVMGDVLIEFTREGKEVWRWNAFDALDPYRIGYETFDGYWTRRGFPDVKADFSHANGVMYDAADDSYVVNFRMLSNVVKVDRKTKEIKWILGDPKGLKPELQAKAFRLEPKGARWFYHQHAPTPTPWGTFMVFDNSNYRAWPFDKPATPGESYSRAVEYKLDEKRRVAREVWVSEKDPSREEWAYSIAMGDVDPMPKTGNVLVHYGSLMPRTEAARASRARLGEAMEWTRIREYTRGKRVEVVWELVFGEPEGKAKVGWHVYGGELVKEFGR